jgi:hypothetical protein
MMRRNAGSFALMLAAAAAFVLLSACGETKKLNKTYSNPTRARYLVVKYKIYGGGNLAPYIPATCFTGTNAPPTPGGCPTGHVRAKEEDTWIMYWDLGPTPGAQVHVGCNFVKVGTGSTATYPIDLEEISSGFQATAPTPGSQAREFGAEVLSQASPLHREPVAESTSTTPALNPAPIVEVTVNDAGNLAIITVSKAAPGTLWLQKLQLAASSVDVPINNVVWGDPFFESLPWQSPRGDFPRAVSSRSLIYYVPVTRSDLSQLFVYVRYEASSVSASSPPDQQGGVQYPMP